MTLCVAAAAIAGVAVARGGDERVVALLPDLDIAAPGTLAGETRSRGGRPRFLLGFGSAVDNVGDGPLAIDARRSRRSDPTMAAWQLVRYSDGRTRASRRPFGVVRYVHSADHQHWHLLRFMRYELRRAGSSVSIRLDRKTGFCLGDRYETDTQRRLKAEPANPVYTEECGRNRPSLMRVREGISVGFGDDYDPTLEGQWVDLTGLRAGRYVLVHRVNVERRVRETSYTNNASSMRFELSWPRGMKRPPKIDVIARCADSERCPSR